MNENLGGEGVPTPLVEPVAADVMKQLAKGLVVRDVLLQGLNQADESAFQGLARQSNGSSQPFDREFKGRFHPIEG